MKQACSTVGRLKAGVLDGLHLTEITCKDSPQLSHSLGKPIQEATWAETYIQPCSSTTYHTTHATQHTMYHTTHTTQHATYHTSHTTYYTAKTIYTYSMPCTTHATYHTQHMPCAHTACHIQQATCTYHNHMPHIIYVTYHTHIPSYTAHNTTYHIYHTPHG